MHSITNVAAPYGGVKESGFGKDLGRDALNKYMKANTINVLSVPIGVLHFNP